MMEALQTSLVCHSNVTRAVGTQIVHVLSTSKEQGLDVIRFTRLLRWPRNFLLYRMIEQSPTVFEYR